MIGGVVFLAVCLLLICFAFLPLGRKRSQQQSGGSTTRGGPLSPRKKTGAVLENGSESSRHVPTSNGADHIDTEDGTEEDGLDGIDHEHDHETDHEGMENGHGKGTNGKAKLNGHKANVPTEVELATM